MTYTVGEMAKLLGIPASTLRYYDREGLLPFVERSSGGIRRFRDSDMEWLRVITCMKSAGMSLRDIREYIQLALRGDDTIEARLRLFLRQRAALEERMEELRRPMGTLVNSCCCYETYPVSGCTDVPQNLPEAKVPPRFRAIRRELRKAPEPGREERCG